MNFPRQVRYYEYFPAIHLLSITTTFISGLPLETCHYTVNAIVFALSSLILIYAIKHSIGKRTFSPIMLYAFIPTIATWGYWIIPMMFAIIFVMFSLYAISRLLRNNEDSLKSLCLCFLFIALPIMIHPAVGLLALIYIPFVILSVAFINRKLSKPLVILLCISLIYAYAYWSHIGFTNQLSTVYTNIYNKISHGIQIPSSLEKLFTRSLIAPPKVQIEKSQEIQEKTETIQQTNQSLQITQETTGNIEKQENQETTLHGRVIDYTNFLCLATNTNLYIATVYEILPRWIWASLVIIMPFITLILYRKKLSVVGFSACVYGLLLYLLVIFSLYLQFIHEAERYIGSPATIFIILALSISLLYEKKSKKLLHYLTIIMLIAGLADPRISFYVNQFEGDRVTFNHGERIVFEYIVRNYNNSKIATDYNLMTSLAWYYSNKYNISLNIVFGTALRGRWILNKQNIIMVIRKYSIFSEYIHMFNYMDMDMLDKFSFYSLLIYSNGETLTFYR